MKRFTFLAPLLLFAFPADSACHHYSIWKYPWAQRCSDYYLRPPPPMPPFKTIEQPPEIPLPSLEGMRFEADCAADWCQRLKGIGLLREKLGTN